MTVLAEEVLGLLAQMVGQMLELAETVLRHLFLAHL
jgi:hypothetical protein